MKFTQKQIDDWKAVESVRQFGEWNMLSKEALEASDLKKEDYLFVLSNYTALESAQAE